MNKVPRTATPSNSLYERDFFEWVTVQAELLRARRLTDLDVDNLTEEIEAIGRSQLHDVRRRLTKILRAMLKWKYQPDLRCPDWASALKSQREDLAAVLAGSPSLRVMVEDAIPRPYHTARIQVLEEDGLFRIPDRCEWTGEEVLDPAYLPR